MTNIYPNNSVTELSPSTTVTGASSLTTNLLPVFSANTTTGYTGSRGFVGSVGTRGFTGSAGTQGPVGYAGSAGTRGANGVNGATGPVGPRGFTGSQGLTGAGFVGSQGIVGFTGSQGAPGDVGATGASGPAGAPGGYTGSQGDSAKEFGGLTSTTTVSTGVGTRIFYTNKTSDESAFQFGSPIVARANVPGSIVSLTGSVWRFVGNVLTVNVASYSGSGTIGNWAFSLAGARGPAGVAGDIGYTGSAGNTILNFGTTTSVSSIDTAQSILSFVSRTPSTISIDAVNNEVGFSVLTSNVASSVVETVYNAGTIDSAQTVTPNYNNGTIQTLLLQNNITLNTPINMPVGSTMTLIITQDSLGSRRMTPNPAYRFASNINALSTTANSIDMLNIVKITESQILAALTLGYQ